ncbi:hypothetical protein ABTO49_20430, partial [Acinetobacter baumannii]
TLTYNALVTQTSDNVVKLVFNVDPKDSNIFIVGRAGARVKSLAYTQKFPVGTKGTLTKVVSIDVLNTPGDPVLSPVSLVATSAADSSDTATM